MSLLKELAGNPDWVGLLKAAEQMCPELPEWDRAENNVEEWKEKSAMRQGFLLCLQIFKPK